MKKLLSILIFFCCTATAQPGAFFGLNKKAFIGSQVFAKWNSADKSANVTLSNNDLTAARNGGTGTVRSTVGKSTGKWYWEITLNTAGNAVLGIAKNSASLSTVVGSDVNGYGMFVDDGTKLNNGPVGAYGSACANGDIIGVAMDLDAGTVTLYKNNVSWGVMFSGLSGTFYAAYSCESLTSQVTANFGETTFTYTPPSGHTGLYTNL